MGRSLDAKIGYGIEIPDSDSGYTLLDGVKYELLEKHGNPKHHHQCVDRPSRDGFDSRVEWSNHVDQMKQEWYENTSEGQKRKAFEDEWDGLGLDTVSCGVGEYLTDCLVDKDTLITGSYEPKQFDGLPEEPDNFVDRVHRLLELAGVEWEVSEDDPSWLLVSSYW